MHTCIYAGGARFVSTTSETVGRLVEKVASLDAKDAKDDESPELQYLRTASEFKAQAPAEAGTDTEEKLEEATRGAQEKWVCLLLQELSKHGKCSSSSDNENEMIWKLCKSLDTVRLCVKTKLVHACICNQPKLQTKQNETKRNETKRA